MRSRCKLYSFVMAAVAILVILICTTKKIITTATNANSTWLRSAQSSVRNHIRSAAPVIAVTTSEDAESFLPEMSISRPDGGPSAANISNQPPAAILILLKLYGDASIPATFPGSGYGELVNRHRTGRPSPTVSTPFPE